MTPHRAMLWPAIIGALGILSTGYTLYWTPMFGGRFHSTTFPLPIHEDVPVRFLEALRIFRTIANLPDFADKEAVREWLISLLGIAQSLTDRTPNEADDKVVEVLVRSVDNERLFDPIFDLLTAMLTAPPEAVACTAPPTLAAEAKAAGIDPMTILAIVEAVAAIIKLIRERRGK